MKVKFLGTSSTEGIPGVFCNCEVCRDVKNRGGVDIRTRTQAIVNDDLLIDFNADTNYHAVKNRLRLGDLETLLVTHSHSDHWCAQELPYRGKPFAHNLKYKKLKIYCNAAVKEKFELIANIIPISDEVRENLDFIIAKTYKPVKIGKYTVTAFPSTHLLSEESLVFLIEEKDKTYFYGNDTGILDSAIFDYLQDKNVKLNLVSLDCALGTSEFEYKWHLNYPQVVKTKEEMQARGIAALDCKFVITHISHDYAHKLYADYVDFAAQDGILVARDSLELEV